MADVQAAHHFSLGNTALRGKLVNAPAQVTQTAAKAGAVADKIATTVDLVLFANTELSFATDGATEIRSNPPVITFGHFTVGGGGL